MNLVQDNGARWSLPYAGQRCAAPRHAQLPQRLFDSVASWAFNAHDAGILPPLEEFRIRARLATLDTRWAFDPGIHSSDWMSYQWADHLGMAHAILCDDGGAALLEQTLAGFGLQERCAPSADPTQRWLWPWRRRALRDGLETVEMRVRDDARFHLAPQSLEQAVMEVPAYAAARRANFSRFRLE